MGQGFFHWISCSGNIAQGSTEPEEAKGWILETVIEIRAKAESTCKSY
jgi:hypothetical protein